MNKMHKENSIDVPVLRSHTSNALEFSPLGFQMSFCLLVSSDEYFAEL